jgi:hypothetical protein
MARLIKATMILHNWFIDLQAMFEDPVDPQVPVAIEKWMYIGGDDVLPSTTNLIDGEVAQDTRRLVKDYLFNCVL